ncbi:MAG: molecular chaperone TorD family protein [Coriobacteriales bacterium]|jgi:TorA maturation chaperone TorD|nr:molecular chaperone TorD family protein [Coriobacteriales bacterium]
METDGRELPGQDASGDNRVSGDRQDASSIGSPDPDALQQAIASADICAILSTAFSYPDDLFAQALLDGSFDEDLQACLGELGFVLPAVDTALNVQMTLAPSADRGIVCNMLRKEYSRLFLMPGRSTLIFPYEAAFCHVAEGREGMPMLFIAPATKDVERRMRAFKVLPKSARREPVDSVSCELDFLRFLYTGFANALNQNDTQDLEVWQSEIADFRSNHVDTWIPAFMKRTLKETDCPTYRTLAEAALAALTATATATLRATATATAALAPSVGIPVATTISATTVKGVE